MDFSNTRLDGQKIFVTGADGFIGSHLVEQLVTAGAEVTALVYYNSWSTNGYLDNLNYKKKKEVNIVLGDVRDNNLMDSYVKGQDKVFHLASLIGIPYSYIAPESYIQTNVTGTLNLLQACRKQSNVPLFLLMSTSEVYGSAQYIPIDEKHPLVGQSPYSASKIAAEKLTESFNLSFNMPTIIVRAFNTYGPRQTLRAVIPTLLSQFINKKSEIILGEINTRRDFNYVEDTVFSLIKTIVSEKAIGKIINSGLGQDYSILELLKILSEMFNYEPKIISDKNRLRPKNSEVKQLLCDVNYFNDVVGTIKRKSLNEGLLITKNWMIKNNVEYKNTDYGL